LDDEKKGDEEQGGEEVLVEGDEHTGKLKREFSVEDGEHGKSESRKNPPEHAHESGVVEVEAGDDQEHSGKTEQGKKDVDIDDSLSEEEGFKEGGEHRIGREGEEADSDRGHLDRLKKSHPVDSKYESEKNERDGIFSLGDSQALFGDPKQEGKGDAGKEHPSQDDNERRKSDPFSKEPGQSEQKHGKMDLNEASLLIHDSYLVKALLSSIWCAAEFISFSVTVNYGGIICQGIATPPSGAHGGGWGGLGKDGGDPAPDFY